MLSSACKEIASAKEELLQAQHYDNHRASPPDLCGIDLLDHSKVKTEETSGDAKIEPSDTEIFPLAHRLTDEKVAMMGKAMQRHSQQHQTVIWSSMEDISNGIKLLAASE